MIDPMVAAQAIIAAADEYKRAPAGKQRYPRPWAVMSHYLRHTGLWSRWRVHGTYSSRERAEAGAEREKTRWEKGGTPCETRIVVPGEKRL